jgi:hypothetical protein
MNIDAAKKLQKKMPWKQIFFDSVWNCYRLIDPENLYHYQDETGYWCNYQDKTGHKRKRINPETLIPIHS